MTFKTTFWIPLYTAFILFIGAQTAISDDFSGDIEAADEKVILEQYDAAKNIYQKIIKSSKPSVVVAYAHYKLGTLYKRQNQYQKANNEYEKGLLTLKNAGQPNHQIGKFLAQAIQ